MVFQTYALYPHMTVHQNLAFALKLRRVPREHRTTCAMGGGSYSGCKACWTAGP